ncbi:hypothetical protein [Aliikangiella coralliicola]|uniref:Uncharacterized protein n=1 Tax=Aliikangiella coralliicola TaxID=2592383 RepID=A0A545UGD6_9GAMM|nr:hypothetical protein [Aliikangiella coralliicola]TQV88531.1 hypothetical protein FLL46_08405 [Aliikangiella coralliicola]
MRELYQTHSIDAPNVLDDELDNAIKWQIKDLLDHGVDEVLVSHYRPSHPDNRAKQVTAVVVEKQLVESLINITRESGLLMESIEIEELSIGNALIKHLSEDKIIGFVGEDDKGLVFNFYNGGELCFSRHKKGRFMPKAGEGEFVLDTDQEAQEESFLLETQRTLDYVISQIFRRPLDAILLQQESEKSEALAETIKQLTETDVILISPKVETKQENSQAPNLAEVGLALGMEA